MHGISHWVASAELSLPSQASAPFITPADILSELSKWSRPSCCAFGCASRCESKEKGLSAHRLPTDWYWYVLEGLPSSTRLMWRRSLEERTDKERRKRWKEKKKKRSWRTKLNLFRRKNDNRMRRNWKLGWPESGKAPAKQTQILGWVETLWRWMTKQCFRHAFRPLSHGQSRLHLKSPEERQLIFAFLGWEAESRSARLTSFQVQLSGWRRCHYGSAVSVMQAQWRPLLMKWRLIQL